MGLSDGGAFAAESALTGDRIPTRQGGDLVVHPINHATLALGWNGKVIDVDPVGGAGRFKDLPKPDLILITDIHQDHLDPTTLEAIAASQTPIVVPKAVAEDFPAQLRQHATVLANGEAKDVAGIPIEAVPMYNTTPERLKFHDKGRGNGYILTLGGSRVYLSGDTENIPEMRALEEH